MDNSDADSYLLALGGVALYDYMVKKGLDPQQDPLLISVRDRILALKDESECKFITCLFSELRADSSFESLIILKLMFIVCSLFMKNFCLIVSS